MNEAQQISRAISVSSPKAIAQRVEFVRHHLGLSQTEFAEMLEITASLYNNWKQSHRLSLDGGIRIAQKCGVPLDFLYLGRTDALPAQMLKSWVENSKN